MRSQKLPDATWTAVRVMAQAVGLRKAARHFATHGVTESAARKRSQRERWADDGSFGMKPVPVTMSPPAATAAQVMAAEVQDLSGKTRIGLARGIAKAAQHVEGRTGAENLDDAQSVKAVAQTADLLHGWKDTAPQVKIRLDVLGCAQEMPLIDVEWQAIDDVLEEY